MVPFIVRYYQDVTVMDLDKLKREFSPSIELIGDEAISDEVN